MRLTSDFNRSCKIIKAFVHGITEIVDTTVEMRYASALEINSQQVAADDNSDGPPLVDNRVHLG